MEASGPTLFRVDDSDSSKWTLFSTAALNQADGITRSH